MLATSSIYAIRPISLSRKSCLFCDTQARARTTALVFTVLETAKINEVNLNTFLNYMKRYDRRDSLLISRQRLMNCYHGLMK